MKKFLGFLFLVSFAIAAFEFAFIVQNNWFTKEIIKEKPVPKPLLAYTFENLKKTIFPKTQITLEDVVDENEDSVSQIFSYSVPKAPGGNTLERASGLMNIPKKSGEYPVIIMFRGFVPDDIYKPGIGTQRVAQVLAKDGFITLAPDFLGFGTSASPSADSFENRFQTYTAALTLFSSLPTLNSGLDASYSGRITPDLGKIGIWGHSNGGHIALSTLAISGAKYPTVLWAPVSTSFPYSIFYYSDESDDQGKALRKTLAGFEDIYDTELFSPINYYKWIKAPVAVNQGLEDQEVPYWWSDNLVSTLKKEDISVEYFTYPGADHNMLPGGWSDAALNTVSFYQKEFSQK